MCVRIRGRKWHKTQQKLGQTRASCPGMNCVHLHSGGGGKDIVLFPQEFIFTISFLLYSRGALVDTSTSLNNRGKNHWHPYLYHGTLHWCGKLLSNQKSCKYPKPRKSCKYSKHLYSLDVNNPKYKSFFSMTCIFLCVLPEATYVSDEICK